MNEAISGAVDNGRRGQVNLPFYEGEVGVRERGDTIELAWFGRPPAFGGATEGALDGAPIRVTAVRNSPLTASTSLRPRGGTMRAIMATAERIDAN